MISRVASHCFWLGRYLERTESTSRLLFVTRNLSLDASLSIQQCWNPILVVLGEEDRFRTRFEKSSLDDGEMIERYLTWDDQNPASVTQSLSGARDNARCIREVISLEAWEAINEMYLWLNSESGRLLYQGHRYDFFRSLRQQCQLCLGVLRNTMLHDDAFDFIWLGVMLERAIQTARTLDVHYPSMDSSQTREIFEATLWISLLRACSALEPFMKRHPIKMSLSTVSDFLIFEPRFPRSVQFCVQSAHSRLRDIIPLHLISTPIGNILTQIRDLESDLRRSQHNRLDPDGIHPLLIRVVDQLETICAEIERRLFSMEAP